MRNSIVCLVLSSLLVSAANAAVPTVGDPSDPGSLSKQIANAYQSGAKSVKITPGRYEMPVGAGDSASLALHDMKDFTIDAAGVEIVAHDHKDVAGFYNCTGVTFRGATLHYDRPLTGQAKIIKLGHDDAGDYYDAQIDPGFLKTVTFSSSYIFDAKTRQWKRGTWDMGAKKVEPRDQNGLVRIHWDGKALPPDLNVAVGDYVVCRGEGSTLLHDDGCTGCVFQDLKLYWGGVFGIFDTGANGNTFRRITLTYGPPPPGSTVRSLLSQSADAFHCPEARRGPTLDHCLFEGMCDDGIAIHGGYVQVDHADGNDLIVGRSWEGTVFKPGDPIRVYNNKTGWMDQAKVISANSIDYTATQKSSLHAYQDKLHYYRLTLDHPVAATFDCVAADPAACGAGYHLIGNTIRNNRARGLLLKADDGVVEGNTIDGSTIAGIIVAPEVWWPEADYSHNVVLSGNTIRHTAYATLGPWSDPTGGMIISGDGAMGNENITIENNKFEDIDSVNLIVRYSRNVKVSGNRFDNPLRLKPLTAPDRGIDQTATVWVGDCKGVTITNNHITHPGPLQTKLLAVAASATDVKGESDGVK